MSPPRVPGYPSTSLPQASQGDSEFEVAVRAARQAERVAEAVEVKLGGQLGKLEGHLLAVDQRLADLELMLSKARAFAASTTLKIVMGMIGSGGFSGLMVRLLAPEPPPTQTVIQRGELDRKLDVCRELRDGAERGACVGRAAAEDAARTPSAR